MAILAIALIILCLGSVSAVDDNQFNSTLETVNDNSQNENIVIDEISDADDAGERDAGVVSVVDEKRNENLLKASYDDVLGAENIVIQDSSGATSGTISVNYPGTVSFSFVSYAGGTSIPWYASGSNAVNVYYVDGSDELLYSTTTLSDFMSKGATFTPSKAGTFEIYIECESGFGSDYSQNLVYEFTSGSASTKQTEVTITVPSTGTAGTSFNIQYSVTEKGSTTGVNAGTLTFYDQNGQIGSPITLSSLSGTFTHKYSSAGTYNIYAKYSAASGYEDSESGSSKITVSNNGDSPSLSDEITLSFAQGSASDGTKYLYPFNDESAWVSVDGGNNNPTYVNFVVDYGTNSESSPKIQWKKSTDSTWNDITFSGNSPRIGFSNGKYTDVTYAGGSTYDVRVTNGDKTSNTLTVSCISGHSYINDFDYDPKSGDEGETISFKFKPIITSGYAFSQGYVSFFTSESRDAGSKIGTLYATSASEFDNQFLTGEITLPQVDSTGEITVYYVFVGYISATGGYNDLDKFTLNVNDVAQVETVTPEIAIDTNATNIKQSEKVKVNVTVSSEGAAINEGQIAFYYDGDDSPIESIDLAEKDYIEIDSSSLTKGNTYTVYAKYLGVENKYETNTSEKKQFKVKSALPVTITVNGESDEVDVETSYSASVTIVADTGSVNPELTVFVDGEANTTKISSGRTQTSYYAYASNMGQHNISVKFAGNDDYEESVSNNVTLNIYQLVSVSPTMTFNVTNYAVEGDKVLITVTTADEVPLNVTLYSDSSAANELAHLEGDAKTYELTLDETTGSDSSYSKTIYGSYDGATVGYVKYYANGYNYDFSKSFTVARKNAMSISSNIADGKIDFGSNLTLSVSDITYWYRIYSDNQYVSGITVYMDNDDTVLGVFPVNEASWNNYVIDDLTVTLDDAAKYEGQHSVYAKYSGYYYDGGYYSTVYAPATSNAIEFVVKQDKTATVEVIADKYPANATVKVTSDVEGTYVVDINGTPVTVIVPQGQTIGETSYKFDAGSYYANITTTPESDLYNVKTQNTTFSVEKGDVSELRIIVNQIPAGQSVCGTVIASVSGTYSVKIADNNPFDVVVDGTTKSFESDIVLSIGENYVAEVSMANNKNYNDYTNKTTFDVVANAVDFKANSTKGEYEYGEEVILTYELPKGADGEITFTYVLGKTGEAGKITVPAQTQLSLGTSLDVKEYSVQASYNGGTLYSSATKTVNFKITPKANDVTVSIDTVTYGNPVVVQLKNAVEGTYTVTVNGKPVTVEVGSDGTGSASEAMDLAVGSGYLASVSLNDGNYATSGSTTFDVIPAFNEITVRVSPVDVTYGGNITVTVEASVPDVYEVNIAGKTINVNVVDKSASNSTSLDLAVGENYEAKVSWANANYTATIKNATFNVVKAQNNVEVVINAAEYGKPLTVTLNNAVEGVYTVTVNGKPVTVEVGSSGSGSASETVDLAVGTGYPASVSMDNDNYETSGSTTFDVTPATNKVTVEVASVTSPAEVTVNVTADVAGTYRVYVNETSYVDVVVTSPNVKASQTKKLDVGDYATHVEFENANYTNDVTNAQFSVYHKKLTAELDLRVYDYLDNDTTVTVTFTDSYDLVLAYKLEKPDAEFIGESLKLYYNGEPVNDLAINIEDGQYVRFSTSKISEEGTITVKLVYLGTLADATTFLKESNELTINLNKQEEQGTVSTHIKIRDYDYPDASAINIDATSDKVTVRIQYQFERTGGTFGDDYDVKFIVGESENDMGKLQQAYSWTGAFQFDVTQSATFTIKAVYTDYIFMQGNIEETSNVLKYTINFPEGQDDTISIESAEVSYGTKASLSVNGSDGEYSVTVDGKPYDVTVVDGTGTAVIDILAAGKTYDVEIVSKTDVNLKNQSTLKVNPISPGITVDADNKEYVYGALTTITVGKNATATGTIKVFDGEVELTSLENVKLAAGNHTIKAKYAADGNFTDGEAEITINVAQATNEISLEVTNETYPDNVTITLTATLPGEYTVMIGATPYKIEVQVNGVGTASYRITTGNHTAAVNFEDNGNYSANSAQCEFEVKGTNVGLNATVSPNKTELGETVQLNTSAKITDATGKVVYHFDDGTEDVEAQIGESVPYTPKTAGTHVVEITYGDDGVYSPQTVTLTVDVAKKKNNIKVSVDASEYPSNVTITVEADVVGDYVVDINGTSYTLTVSDKSQTKSVLLDAGSYYANVTAADDDYEVTSTNTTFEVKKGTISIEITTEDVKLPNLAHLDVKSDVDGTYTVNVGEKSVDVKVENGTGSADVKLDEGSYTPSVDYSNKNYEVSLIANQFNVTLQQTDLAVELRDKNYPENATVVFVGEKYESVLEYFVQDPTVLVSAPEINVFINGVHPTGYGVYNGITYNAFTGLGSISFNQTGKYVIKIQYKTASLLTEGFDVNSTEITYDITIIEKVDENVTLSLEIEDTTYPHNATATVKATDDGTYTVTVGDKPYNVTVSNGTGSVVLDVFDAGNYTASVVSNTNASLSNKTTFAVSKGKNNIKVEVDNVTLPENATVKITADVDGTYIVKIKGNEVKVDVSGGVGTATIALDAGNYYTTLDYDDANYEANIENANFIVSPKEIEGNLSIRDASNPTNITIAVEGDGNVTISIEYYIIKPLEDATTERIEFSFNGNVTKVIDDVLNGTYTKVDFTLNETSDIVVGARYYAWKLADNEYELTSNTLTYHIIVNEIAVENETVSISVDSPTYPNNATATVKATKDGIYDVSVGNKSYNVDVINGSGSVVLDVLDVGNYTASVASDTNSSLANETSFTVSKGKNNIKVSVGDVTLPENVTVTVSADVPGVYTVKIGDKTVDVMVDDIGTNTIALDAGEYAADVIYSDNNYDGVIIPATFKVSEEEKTENGTDETVPLTVKVDDVTYGENATVVVNAKDGQYSVKVADKTYDVVVTNGTGGAVIDELPSGEYDVSVVSKDNASVSNNTKLNVLKSDKVNLDVAVDGDRITVNVSSDATGNISVTIANKTYTQPIENGQVVINISDVAVGNHSMDIAYSGDKNYQAKSASSSLVIPEVSKLATKIEITSITGSHVVKGILLDVNGNILPKYILRYAIDGVENNLTTLENGTFTIQAENNAKVEIFFNGDEKYIESNASIILNRIGNVKLGSQFNVTEGQSILTYAVDFPAGERGTTFQFLLTDSNGKPIANAPVQFVYKTVILNRTTDENGIVFLGVSTQFADSYLCALSYLGDETHNATFVAFNFKLDKKPITISAKAKTFKKSTKTKKYTITLKTSKCASKDGKVYLKSGKKVTLKVNGKTYTAKINAKGQATFKITKLTKKGKYTATIKFAGDKTYKAVSKKVKITIR